MNLGQPSLSRPASALAPPTSAPSANSVVNTLPSIHTPCDAPLTTFRINTCKSVSKQTTLTPFRMNTYAKPGGGGPHHFRALHHARAAIIYPDLRGAHI